MAKRAIILKSVKKKFVTKTSIEEEHVQKEGGKEAKVIGGNLPIHVLGLHGTNCFVLSIDNKPSINSKTLWFYSLPKVQVTINLRI